MLRADCRERYRRALQNALVPRYFEAGVAKDHRAIAERLEASAQGKRSGFAFRNATRGNHGVPHLARKVRDFHKRRKRVEMHALNIHSHNHAEQRTQSGFQIKMKDRDCTKTGHRAVNGVHSIEKTCTYKRRFSIDEKNRRSRTGSFFDSFLSFSGWCGVRGSSEVTFCSREEKEGK